MPGPADHVADQEGSPGRVRLPETDSPREARVPADLRARLERLPVGHPSSPYRDDGSRKAPPPDLTELELPLPHELPSGAEAADRDLGSKNDAARTSADGSWDWKGHHLTADQARVADRALATCRDAEGRDAGGNYGDHGLTPAMRRIEAQLEHGHLADGTETFALKDPDRFKEKLAKLIGRHPGADAEKLAGDIADGIRYTFIFDFEHYTDGVEAGHTLLAEAGHERIETRPSWDAEEYKGANSRWRDPSAGPVFEVQFHTDESWDAKQKTHGAYRSAGAPGTSIEQTEWLRAYQREVWAGVSAPPGALEIRPYKKERQAEA